MDDPWRGGPPPAPPGANAPLSTSGTDLAPPMTRPPVILTRSDPATTRRLRALEARIQALEAQQREPPWWRRVRVSAFAQPQFVAQLFNADASFAVAPLCFQWLLLHRILKHVSMLTAGGPHGKTALGPVSLLQTALQIPRL